MLPQKTLEKQPLTRRVGVMELLGLCAVFCIMGYFLLSYIPFFQHIGSPPPPSSSSGGLVGKPSLSASFVDQVLKDANSPAVGIGQTLVELSQKYNIDNAYALAFFHHESSYGTQGVAVPNHNWGNIRCTDGYSCGSGFRSYESWEEGAEDWYRLLSTLYIPHGLDTMEKVISVYAPAEDNNDEAAYVQAVENDVHQWKGTAK